MVCGLGRFIHHTLMLARDVVESTLGACDQSGFSKKRGAPLVSL